MKDKLTFIRYAHVNASHTYRNNDDWETLTYEALNKFNYLTTTVTELATNELFAI